MKKLLTLLLVVFLVTSCNKDDTPQPIQKSSTQNSIVDTTCANSTWKYEVSLGTPVAAGTFQIRYNDEFGTQLIDTTITSSWSKTFTMQHAGFPSGLYQLIAQVEPGPSGLDMVFNQNTNLVNTIMITIYQNGNIVQTTGVPYQYCYGTVSPCNVSNPSVQKAHTCNE